MNRILYAVIVSVFLISCSQAPVMLDWTPGQETKVRNVISQVNTNTINQHLTGLNMVRHVLSPQLTNAVLYLTNTLTVAGCSVELQPLQLTIWNQNAGAYTNVTMNNIIATRTGTDPALEPVLVVAHYDSVLAGPGMDDNASGCAGLLECARATAGVTTARSLIFLLTAFEEYGLRGAEYYVSQAARLPCAVINLEMIGFTSEHQTRPPLTDWVMDFPDQGNFVIITGSQKSTDLSMDYTRTASVFEQDLPYLLIQADDNLNNNPLLSSFMRSDHTPFWNRKVPALAFSDTADFRNPWYHTTNDTLETLNQSFTASVTRSALALMLLKAEVKE